MDNQIYIDPILKKYADIITAGNKEIKRVYFGDPVRIGSSELPALILAKVDTRVSNHTNAEDRHDIRISISVVTDIRDTISDDRQIVPGVNSLYNLMEGRESDYTLKTDSILYLIRHNAEIDIANNLRTDIDSLTQVGYGMTMGKRGETSWSIEGTIELLASFTQIR